MGCSQFGGGEEVTEMQVSSTKASKLRLAAIGPDGLKSLAPGLKSRVVADKIVLLANSQIIGEAPLPCPHSWRGLVGVDVYQELEMP